MAPVDLRKKLNDKSYLFFENIFIKKYSFMSSIKVHALLKILLLSLALQGASTLMAQSADSVKSAVYAWNTLQVKKGKTSTSRQIFKGSTLDLAYYEMHATTLEPGKAPHPAHTHG